MSSLIIFKLAGSHAGETIRLGGFDFVNGELQVPAANVDQVEPQIKPFGAKRKRQGRAPHAPVATPTQPPAEPLPVKAK